jgi:enoyl-[acyl-carrier protein] reductase I
MIISCFSFTEVAKRTSALMTNGGALLTLTFGASQRVVPSYNVMGVAKAALEASVRYLAHDLGQKGIRVNALSSGPMRTVAGSVVADARAIFKFQRDNAPLRRTPTLDQVGRAALYLVSDLSTAVTGEVHYVDCGYNVVAVPNLDALRS